jgi:hypothetical protein
MAAVDRAPGRRAPDETDVIRVPANWRIIATMNVFDKNLLFDMSYALMRRFAFIEVGTPDEAYETLLDGRAGSSPAARRCGASATSARPSTSTPPLRGPPSEDGRHRVAGRYEVFYAYFLPQFEGMDGVAVLLAQDPLAGSAPGPEGSAATATGALTSTSSSSAMNSIGRLEGDLARRGQLDPVVGGVGADVGLLLLAHGVDDHVVGRAFSPMIMPS